MISTAELRDDPALPALAVIRKHGLSAALPALGLGTEPVELRLCNYAPGSRATFEARTGDRRFAVKLYADDPSPEVELYQALALVGLAGNAGEGPRVPPLLAWQRDLRVLVLGWLSGPPASQLIKEGRGVRAGELAASWLRRAAALPVRVGPPCGPGRMLYQAGVSVAALSVVDRGLGGAAKAVARVLGRTQPREGPLGLVHGTLYARHIFDLGDGPGVIDWQQFGQGPVELDAGMFLATISRLALRRPSHAGEVARAEEAFVAGTCGLLDSGTVEWYRAAGLLHLAASGLKTGNKTEPPPEARALLEEAGRRVEPAARRDRARVAAPAFGVGRAALELVLQALSTRPATPEELEQIRKLLDAQRSPGT